MCLNTLIRQVTHAHNALSYCLIVRDNTLPQIIGLIAACMDGRGAMLRLYITLQSHPSYKNEKSKRMEFFFYRYALTKPLPASAAIPLAIPSTVPPRHTISNLLGSFVPPRISSGILGNSLRPIFLRLAFSSSRSLIACSCFVFSRAI